MDNDRVGEGLERSEDVGAPYVTEIKLIRSTTPGNFMPYLSTILALLSTLYTTRSPSETFAASPQFSELVLSLATVLDVMEAKSHLGKESVRDARYRHRIGIKTWRVMRQVSESL